MPNSLNMRPAVSVVMPVYNAEATLEAAVYSIRDQTLSDWELIAVDDGSTDTSGALLDRLAAEDARLRVIHIARQGVVGAANAGTENARAEYIARMDADDISDPSRLQVQADWLHNNPDTDLLGTQVIFGGDRATAAGFAAYVDWTNTLISEQQIRLNRFIESPFANPSVMFRQSSWKRYGGYLDCGMPEDYELLLRWLDQGAAMSKIPQKLVTWNDPPERLSRTHSRYAVMAFYRCKAYYLARWLAKNNPHHREVVIWGAGRTTRKRAEMLEEQGARIKAFIDIDPRKIGQRVHGRPVWSADTLPPPEDCFIVSYVGRRGARADVRSRLQDAGYVEGANFLLC